MALIEESEVRNVKGISLAEAQRIKDFLQGAIYCWCKNRKDEWFSLRDLMGGDNFYWEGTPLMRLYKKHKGVSSESISAAGKDAGWLLKSVVSSDKRNYESKHESLIRKYRWVDLGSET